MWKPVARSITNSLSFMLFLAFTSCLPMISNVSKGDTVPAVIASEGPPESEILVLPFWSDQRSWNFHDPYVIPISAIGTPQASVPPRRAFYFEPFVCGGPPMYITDYLVVLESGTVIWTDSRGSTISRSSTSLKAEVRSLLSEGRLGPGLAELMQWEPTHVGLVAEDQARSNALRFLDKISQ